MQVITAVDASTGKAFYFDGTTWHQFVNTATNHTTGERLGLLNNEWIPINTQSKVDIFNIQGKIVEKPNPYPSVSADDGNTKNQINATASYSILAISIDILITIIFSLIFYKLFKSNTKRNRKELAFWLGGWFAIGGFLVSFAGQFGTAQSLIKYPSAWDFSIFLGVFIPTLFMYAIGFATGFIIRINHILPHKCHDESL